MERFFDFSVTQAEAGFGLFSEIHLAWLVFALAAVLLAGRIYKKAQPGARRALRLKVALSALGLEWLRVLIYAVNGEYGLNTLPLHLCGLAVYLCAAHALRRKSGGLLPQFLYAFCMPGAAFALVFPDWTYYPAAHFVTVSAFLLHILICVYVLMQVRGGDIVPEVRRAPACLALMAGLALPVYLFDRATGMNYMFLLAPSPGSPLEWFAFLGRPGYLLGYLPLLAAVWLVLYGLTRHGRKG